MYDLSKIKRFITAGKYRITLHTLKRLDQRQITVSELKEAILSGVIVETYPDDKPFPSCLIMGKIRGGFPLYVVCGISSDAIHIITTHWMDPAKWLDPTTRREKKT